MAAAAAFTRALTADELSSDALAPETLAFALGALDEHGVVVLRKLIAPADAVAERARFEAAWATVAAAMAPLAPMWEGHLQDVVPRFAEVAPRGPRRYSISTFRSAAMRQNALVVQLMGASPMAQGGASGCWSEETVVSLPGATEQRVHVDAGHLYDPKQHGVLPAYHYSVFISLVDQDSTTGNTAFALGTHRSRGGGHESQPHWDMPGRDEFVDAYLKAGDSVIFDSRLYHFGRANSGTEMRPIYGLMYSPAGE